MTPEFLPESNEKSLSGAIGKAVKLGERMKEILDEYG